MVSTFVLLTAVVVALLAGPEPVIGAITASLQSILKNTHGSKEYGYPTDITRDIYPVSEHLISVFLPSMGGVGVGVLTPMFRFPYTLTSRTTPTYLLRIAFPGYILTAEK